MLVPIGSVAAERQRGYRLAPMRVLLAALLLTLAAPLDAATLGPLVVADGARPRVEAAISGRVDAPLVLALSGPDRLVVDLDGVQTRSVSVAATGLVAGVRAAQFTPATTRLVLRLGEPARVAAAAQRGDGRLVLTLERVSTAAFAAMVKRGRTRLRDFATAMDAPSVEADFDLPDGMFAPRPPPAAAASPPSPPQRAAGRLPLVAIDAGHGGKDVGAIAVTGMYEKDATLAIARAAAAALERGGRVRVTLIRADDRFVTLSGRVALARAAKAALFVSIHADSAPNPLARGASVYTLSETASDAAAARLAARENKADIIAGVDLGVDAPEVSDILIDLVKRDTMNTAIRFAETLQRELGTRRIGFRNQFHHFAGFRVLTAAEIPSVLLETGYLSNAEDAALLASADGRRRIGEGIAAAVEAHLAGEVR